ncbi:MAG: glycosyltransferase family 39 protein [Acidobacteria bacterium]|nr:glycosyltransferase family 39 protein [Acidobacteriota bacterium]
MYPRKGLGNKLYIILVSVLLLYCFTLNGRLTDKGDDAGYIILAKSLALGEGYRLISHPAQPPETRYPPLFPFLLMPLVRSFPQNYLILKLIPLLFSLATILVFAFLVKILLPQKGSGMFLVIIVAISPIIVDYSTQLLTEPVYAFFSLLTLYLSLYLDIKGDNKLLIALALTAVSAYYCRYIGISLIIAIILLYLIRRRYRVFLFLSFLMVIAILPWMIRNNLLGGGGYVASFLLINPYDIDAGTITFIGFIKRLLMNGIRYGGKVIPDLIFFPWLGKVGSYNPLKIALGLAVSALILLGFYRNIRTKINLLNIYTLIYFLICLIWPWYDTRFLVPLLPLILLFLIQGTNELATFLSRKKSFGESSYRNILQKGLRIGVILFLLLGSGWVIYEHHWGRGSPEWRDYHQACLWLRNNTPEESIILCRKPRYTYLISGRKAICYPYTSDDEYMIEFLKKYQPDYIIFDRLKGAIDTSTRYLKPFLLLHQDIFIPFHQVGSSGTYIYKRIGELKENR